MIGGDSSGGGLTANMTQRAALNNKDWFRYQIFLYPALGSFNFQSQSYKDYHKTQLKSVLSPEGFAPMVLTYLGIKPTKESIKELMNMKKASKHNKTILHDFQWIKRSTHGEFTLNGTANYEMVKEVKYFLHRVNALNN
uniref:Abhydrolase_3 domain-containing protein n=1 Tax=Rhabditophanes sp. KR3021 TaxID=114890 RepID=A0AC35TW09_9BILA